MFGKSMGMPMGMDDDDSQMGDDSKMQIIHELMEQLQGLMEPGADDLGERLGRPKQMDVMAIKAGGTDPDTDQDPMGSDMGDMGSDDSDMDQMSPDNMLRKRLMNLRG